MTDPHGRREMRELLDRHGVAPRKALGQHFLADPNIVRRIVRLSGAGAGSSVIEIGAGTGTLTRGLAATGARVVAYEVDRGLQPVLAETVGHLPNVDMRFEDAADLDAGYLEGEWMLVANLPYNVGTPLLLDLLRHAPAITTFVVMVQKEVADRLTAQPGGKLYGLPTVVVDLHAEARIEFTVRPEVFFPPPQVGSAVVRLRRRAGAPASSERAVEIAAAAFSQRRKMIRSSLRDVIDDVAAVCRKAGIDPTSRAETLDSTAWLALAAEAP